MQFQILAVALGLTSVAMSAPASNHVQGVKIRASDAPVATSLNIVQRPAAVEKREIEKRAVGHLFVCTNSFFGGTCQNLQFTTGVCNNLFGTFQDSISSAGPDQGFTCTVWADSDCKGQSVTFPNPGIQDFNTVSPNINDKISSYRCN